jgi:exonuclease III
MLFRKINQLCHPDKTKKFSRMVIVALRDCLDDAQKAYERRDHDILELTLIRVIYLRDELDRLEPGDKRRIDNQHKNLTLDIQGMQLHPLYVVLSCHQDGMMQDAKFHFSNFLQTYLGRLRKMLADMQTPNGA